MKSGKLCYLLLGIRISRTNSFITWGFLDRGGGPSMRHHRTSGTCNWIRRYNGISGRDYTTSRRHHWFSRNFTTLARGSVGLESAHTGAFLGLPTLRLGAGVVVGLGLPIICKGSDVGLKKLLIDFWDILTTPEQPAKCPCGS